MDSSSVALISRMARQSEPAGFGFSGASRAESDGPRGELRTRVLLDAVTSPGRDRRMDAVVFRKSSKLSRTEPLFGDILVPAPPPTLLGMAPDEIRIAEALARCSFVPGSSPKRFARQIAARGHAKPLSDRQRAYLWAIAWSWRRQLPADLVALARKYSDGVGIRGRQQLRGAPPRAGTRESLRWPALACTGAAPGAGGGSERPRLALPITCYVNELPRASERRGGSRRAARRARNATTTRARSSFAVLARAGRVERREGGGEGALHAPKCTREAQAGR